MKIDIKIIGLFFLFVFKFVLLKVYYMEIFTKEIYMDKTYNIYRSNYESIKL